MKKALIGNGGHAREVQAQMGIELFRFVSEEYWKEGDDKLLTLSKFDPDKYVVMIAVADSKDREDIVKQLPTNTQYFTFIHPTAQLMSKNITIDENYTSLMNKNYEELVLFFPRNTTSGPNNTNNTIRKTALMKNNVKLPHMFR